MTENNYIDVVFDGPPSHESGRFVEVENAERASIAVGEWVHRDDGYWVLRLTVDTFAAQLATAKADAWDEGYNAGHLYGAIEGYTGASPDDDVPNPYRPTPKAGQVDE